MAYDACTLTVLEEKLEKINAIPAEEKVYPKALSYYFNKDYFRYLLAPIVPINLSGTQSVIIAQKTEQTALQAYIECMLEQQRKLLERYV